jgi:putative addiction module component (TIGR02574 family)
MAVSIRSLGIDQLAVEDRLALVEELWDSIAADTTAVPLTEAQKAELDRRIAEHEANPDDIVSWQEIRDSIGKRLKA